ncbi:MAG: nucleotidyltransferase family protein [Ignavibacteria bacterium]|nr:nucleotidyltransferase family protein [Ignavibacteria bacterium]
MSIRKAVIMAGGFGTRLRPLTMSIPKPMVPWQNRPMMEHIVSSSKRHGIRDVVFLAVLPAEHITEFFGEGTAHDISMRYMLAGGRLRYSRQCEECGVVSDERFIIISGDVLTDIDIEKAVAFHEERGAMATIVLTRVLSPFNTAS